MIFPKKMGLNIDTKYGDWLVLSYEGKDEKSNQLYMAQCKCGFKKLFTPSQLKKSKSCKSCSIFSRFNIDDLIEKNIGNCQVLSKIDTSRGEESKYLTKCKCGKERIVLAYKLKQNKSTSCANCRIKKHGMSYTKTFKIWTGILRRCLNSNFKKFNRYGGRGIKVCESWLKFENFLKDMGERPEGLEIDRINNDGNYEPSNCRWVTRKENCNNKNNSKNLRGAL